MTAKEETAAANIRTAATRTARILSPGFSFLRLFFLTALVPAAFLAVLGRDLLELFFTQLSFFFDLFFFLGNFRVKFIH